jgi:hypothetical protein
MEMDDGMDDILSGNEVFEYNGRVYDAMDMD